MAAADPGTDSARQEVLRAREELLEEFVRLGAAGRAAIDVKAKVQRSPAMAAAAVGGATFLAVGGPKRIVRGIRRVVRGPAPAYPKSMLPDEIERVVRSLGGDGDKVRGALERDFAAYATAKKKADRSFWRSALFLGFIVPVGSQIARAGTRWLLQPDDEKFAEWVGRIRARLGLGGPKPEDLVGGDPNGAAGTATPGEITGTGGATR